MRLIIKEKGHPARTVYVTHGETTIGRSRRADVQLTNFYASGRHCQLTYDGETLVLRDLQTTNGTFCNGQKIDQTTVREGDRFLVGTALILVAGDDDGPDLRQLASQYDEGEEAAREQVIGMLGELGDPTAVGLLGRALQDESAAVREAAAASLGSIGVPGAGAELVVCLSDPQAAVRRRATWAMIRCADPEAVTPLIRVIQLGDEDAQLAAINIAGMLRIREAAPALIGALDAEVHRVREAAIKGLGALGDTEAVPRLIDALGQPERFPLVWTVEALGMLGDKRALPHLVEHLGHTTTEVREAAAHALGQVWSRQSVTHLIGALQDASASVRRSAAASLERIRRSMETGDTPPPPTRRDSVGGTLMLSEIGDTGSGTGGPVELHHDPAYWEAWWETARAQLAPEEETD